MSKNTADDVADLSTILKAAPQLAAELHAKQHDESKAAAPTDATDKFSREATDKVFAALEDVASRLSEADVKTIEESKNYLSSMAYHAGMLEGRLEGLQKGHETAMKYKAGMAVFGASIEDLKQEIITTKEKLFSYLMLRDKAESMVKGLAIVEQKANATNEEILREAARLYQRTGDTDKAAILATYLETHNIHKAAKTSKISVGKASKLIREIEKERGVKIMRRNWAQGEHAGNTYRHGKTGPLAKRDTTHRPPE